MVEYGPIQMIAIGFPDIEKLDGALLKEIFQLSEARLIRVLGLLAVVKDEKGKKHYICRECQGKLPAKKDILEKL